MSQILHHELVVCAIERAQLGQDALRSGLKYGTYGTGTDTSIRKVPALALAVITIPKGNNQEAWLLRAAASAADSGTGRGRTREARAREGKAAPRRRRPRDAVRRGVFEE